MTPKRNSPRLSVVIPVHGVEAYLARCLDSVLAHEGEELEVIAVDDASPDGCAAILDAYAARDSRLEVVRLRANAGLGGARNAGLDRAGGDYVWFVDADDWLAPGAVRTVLDRITSKPCDVLIIDHAEVFPDGTEIGRSSAHILDGLVTPIQLTQRPELLRLSQSACTKVVRRKFLDEIDLRFRPGLYEDSAYSHPLLMGAEGIDVLSEVLYCYRQQTPGAITATPSERHFEVFGQYEYVYSRFEGASGRFEAFRAELFRAMMNHYLVIIGTHWRLPAGTRRKFFKRMVEHYRRWSPSGGYALPQGFGGLKHRLVRANAYPAYAALRLLRKATAPRQRHRGTGRIQWSVPGQRADADHRIRENPTDSRIV